MHYFELTTTVYLLKNVAFNEVNEKIAQLINKAMLSDKELAIKHEVNQFKNYVFDSLYPREQDKIYKAGKIYVFRIRSLEEYFITKIKESFSQVTTDYFKVIAGEVRRYEQRPIKELYTVTPALATIGKNIYWIPGNDIKILIERMNSNLFKKYKNYFGVSLNEEQLFFEKIKVLNKKPLVYKYKNINLFGNKFKIAINDDEISQKLAFMTLGVGLLEKNSTVGMGFCIEGRF
ncbi:MAG: CRISPR-associated endoribonuclease Cas6 [Candidatus Lokiarchaeota archaeon]|nr:CRISPR-associated endoribonuclease Cas6 [Candidatus Lokiarchaeota archaeon]